jgi:hypothetical protein
VSVAQEVEITLACECGERLAAGFAGWQVEVGGGSTLLRRLDPSAYEVDQVLAEIGELGLELDSLRRNERDTSPENA